MNKQLRSLSNCFGKVTIREYEAAESSSSDDPLESAGGSKIQLAWQPPERLISLHSQNFRIYFDCITGKDGLKRIEPCWGLERLIDSGFLGGLAILIDQHGFDEEHCGIYRQMNLINQLVRGRLYFESRGMKEHFTRKFQYSRDMHVRLLGRPDNERDALPEIDEPLPGGKVGRLYPKRLSDVGREELKAAGEVDLTCRKTIPQGFYVAAQREPLDLEGDDILSLIKLSLFDIDFSDEDLSEELILNVRERLVEAIINHTEDSNDKFYDWYLGPNNSFVKQIAKQKKKRGGELDRKDVRRALLYFGWKSYEYVGQCVHVLMRTIKNAMGDFLNDEEKLLFEHMYENQPYYGELPRIMLLERLDFLEPAIEAILAEPHNPRHIGVLHRMMYYYSEMASRRREADRRIKSQGQALIGWKNIEFVPFGCFECLRSEDEGAGLEVYSLDPEQIGVPMTTLRNMSSFAKERFQEVAEHVRELKGVECGKSCGQWEFLLERNQEHDSVVIDAYCACGNGDEEIEISREDFERYVREFLEPWNGAA